MKKIGVFGGTFNPIHNMHIKIAEAARDNLDLDQVIFVPSANPPHKSENDIESFSHRFKMVEVAIEGMENFSVSNIENKIDHKKSYTSETLKALKVIYPDDVLYFIMGSDCLEEIEFWHHPEEVFLNCIIVLFDRPGYFLKDMDMQLKYLREKYGAKIVSMGAVSEAMSSTEIRATIENENYDNTCLNSEVLKYIIINKLYR